MMNRSFAGVLLAATLLGVAVAPVELFPSGGQAPSFVATASAQDEAAPPAAPTETKKSILDYYRDGGALMHPILLCSFVMFALVFELFWRLRSSKIVPPVAVQQLRQLFAAQNYQEAWRLCRMSPSFLTNVLMPSLERFGRGRDIAERVLMDHGMKEASALRTRVLYLSVVAVIAPMLGLLGTVQGMIQAFEVISLGGLGDPGKLAHSIGVALITTFAGLTVGIPSMFFFYFFRNQLAKITTRVEDITNELLEDVPFNELQGVRIGPALEEELQGAAAPPLTHPAPASAPMRRPIGVTTLGAPAMSPSPFAANPAPAPGGGGVNMVNCPNCRALILQNSRVCPNCHAELEWQ